MITELNNCYESLSSNNCPCKNYCPLGNALKLIGGKWKTPILCALHHDGTTRYNELKRKIRGITNTMLASSLKELVNDGLLYRKQYDGIPVRVEYSLTDACEDLMPILNLLAIWGVKMSQE
ncbi:MAG TPA: helix-turn-helix domain-containing protein [Oscillospiraceae bacterium]|nr:helix-turn-helix domain-containing protein [Oscillospiraceae bacterium]